jgi:hypothetical protein
MMRLGLATAIIFSLFALKGGAVALDLPTIKVYDEQSEKIVDPVDFIVDVKDYSGLKVSIDKCTLFNASEHGVACEFSITQRDSASFFIQEAEVARNSLKQAIRLCGWHPVGPECQVSLSGKIKIEESVFDETAINFVLTDVSMSALGISNNGSSVHPSGDELPKISMSDAGSKKSVDIVDFVVDKNDYIGASILIENCLMRQAGPYTAYCQLPLPMNKNNIKNESVIPLPLESLKANDKERLGKHCRNQFKQLGPECRATISGKIENPGFITLKEISVTWKEGR